MSLINNYSGEGRRMVSAKRKLLETFRQTSFRSSDEAVYRLASGKRSKYYVDCKQALSDPEARALIGELIFDLVRNDSLDSIGGLELGAYPVATSVSDVIFRETCNKVRAFVIRKAPKAHGVGDLIAGHAEKGDKTLIVDDVVTTGSSTIQAIRAARAAGLSVERAIVLVDREEDDGRKNIEAEGVKFDALLTLSELQRSCHDSAQDADADSHRERSIRHESSKVVVHS